MAPPKQPVLDGSEKALDEALETLQPPVHCTKSRFVLQLRDAAEWPEGQVLFSREPDDHTDVPQIVAFDHGLWFDFGEPKVITVTVRPGDRLNGA